MKNFVLSALTCLILLMAPAGPPEAIGAKIPAKEEKTWRIAMVCSGPFIEYQLIFQGLLSGLQEQGLIENGAVPLGENESLAPMWAWASAHAGGRRLVFVGDAFYSDDWDQERREPLKQQLLERIRNKKDIDLILTFGTWAGQDLASEDLALPVLVSSVTNAMEAGIITSPDDSGRDNLWASIEPGRYELQLRIFHDIFSFSRLGIAYDDSPSGRSGIALDEIEKAALDLGVELVRCTDAMDIPDADLSADRLLACHRKLVEQGVEAVYVTYSLGMVPKRIPEILSPLIKARIPTFSQLGSDEVRHGALLSISQDNLLDEGRFSASAMAEVMRGKKPRSLPQRYESTISLAVNLRTAMLIGWNPPMEILAAVDQFYQDF